MNPRLRTCGTLQKALLVIGGQRAARARAVARAFHACLRTFDSKAASRSASRWGAALGTAAVGSVSMTEILGRHESALRRLLESGLPAVLEVGSAVKSAQAWEIEARLLYDEFAWILYDQLWDLSLSARPDLSSYERRDQIDLVLDPLLDPAVAGFRPGDARGQRLQIGPRGTPASTAGRAAGQKLGAVAQADNQPQGRVGV